MTFDADFIDLNILKGIPPKIIWLRTGNLTTHAIKELLNKNLILIQTFIETGEDEVLEIVSTDL